MLFSILIISFYHSYRYATSAKRVNVKRLKEDLWKHLEDNMGVEGTGPVDQKTLDAVQPGQKRKKDGRSSESVEPKEKISLQEVVTHMSENETQKEVTFPFYFICLLHLANEHVSILTHYLSRS